MRSVIGRIFARSPWVVLAILFVWFCLLGASAFLLMKELKQVGYIQVTVQGSGFYHSALIPAGGPQMVAIVTQQVNYARTLAGAA